MDYIKMNKNQLIEVIEELEKNKSEESDALKELLSYNSKLVIPYNNKEITNRMILEALEEFYQHKIIDLVDEIIEMDGIVYNGSFNRYQRDFFDYRPVKELEFIHKDLFIKKYIKLNLL